MTSSFLWYNILDIIFQNLLLFLFFSFHVWYNVYMCKYDFIFVSPAYNSFHWLSLAHDYVLYNTGMGSRWDYFPMESSGVIQVFYVGI